MRQQKGLMGYPEGTRLYQRAKGTPESDDGMPVYWTAELGERAEWPHLAVSSYIVSSCRKTWRVMWERAFLCTTKIRSSLGTLGNEDKANAGSP